MTKTQPPKDALHFYGVERALLDQLRWRERMAGIEDAAEHIRSTSYSSLGDRRPRDLYFAVAEEDRRRGLIEAWRALEKNYRDIAMAELEQERRQLAKWRAMSEWGLAEAMIGVGLVAIGHYLQGVPGALGGVVLAFLTIMKCHEFRAQERRSALETSEKFVTDLERNRADILGRRELFSAWEEQHGRPDPNGPWGRNSAEAEKS